MLCVWDCCPAGGGLSTNGMISVAASASDPATVEEGHWGCRVVFWKPIDQDRHGRPDGNDDEERFFVLKTFTVFCADQVEGEAAAGFQVHEEGQPDAQPDFQPAEELILATESRHPLWRRPRLLPPPDA